jgi:hypothetical protein
MYKGRGIQKDGTSPFEDKGMRPSGVIDIKDSTLFWKLLYSFRLGKRG